jgi:hypothetical protein
MTCDGRSVTTKESWRRKAAGRKFKALKPGLKLQNPTPINREQASNIQRTASIDRGDFISKSIPTNLVGIALAEAKNRNQGISLNQGDMISYKSVCFICNKLVFNSLEHFSAVKRLRPNQTKSNRIKPIFFCA